MIERFDEPARRVVALAAEEAQALGHARVDAGHLLVGLLRVEDGLAAQALELFGVTLDGVRSRLADVAVPGAEPEPSDCVAFTPRAKLALELALREARARGRERIATSDILVALAGDEAIRRDLGVSVEQIRKAMLAVSPVRELRPYSGGSRPLTAQEEVDLVTRVQAGDGEAMQQLAEANRPLVDSIVEDHLDQGLPGIDLVLAGMIGLERAAEKYDPARGYRFSTYATTWVRQSIVRRLSEQAP